MPMLHDEIKEFIVKSLARFEAPAFVALAVNEKFNVKVSRQQVYRYDPDNPDPPSHRWRELHAATRRAFLRHVAEIGIAQKAVRLAMLNRMAHDAMSDHYYTRAAGFLEQAAKECGGIYENRRASAPPQEPLAASTAEPRSAAAKEGSEEQVPLRGSAAPLAQSGLRG